MPYDSIAKLNKEVMKHIKYAQFDSTPPIGGFFGNFFKSPFLGIFFVDNLFFKKGGELT